MNDMDLKSLRLLLAVCDCGNIKQAARQEHIEPSAISKRIAQLERLLGTTLLIRGRRGVRPTPACEALIEHARAIEYSVARIEADVAAYASGLRGHVRLAASASAIAESLLDDVAAFMREPANRGIRVEVEERLSVDVVRSVREGSASLGVCWNSIELAGLAHRLYRSDELVLAVHPDHPLATRRSLKFEQSLDCDHVGLPPATAVYSMLHRAAARAGRSLTYRVVVSNFDAALRVVRANLGVSVIPREVSRQAVLARFIAVVPLRDEWARRQFVVCFRDSAPLTPAAARLAEYLGERAPRPGSKRRAKGSPNGEP